MVIQTPLYPALAVLPTLWIYLVTSYGSSKLITAFNSLISNPLAAKSVANKKSYLKVKEFNLNFFL